MKKLIACALLITSAVACASRDQISMSEIDARTSGMLIDVMLDDFHDAAAKADEERYFAHFADDAVFIGTDASERWTLDEFKAFAMPHFHKESAWTYTMRSRHITTDYPRQVAWFDELLHNEAYGEVRGSGVLLFEADTWRIAQYVLSFPVPNQVAKDVVTLIQKPRE